MKTTKQHPDRNWRDSIRAALLSSALLVVISFLLGTASALGATANPPSGIGYQGYLVGSDGSPLADDAPANFLIEFRVYDAETGGAAKYAEVQTVTVDNGAFSVLIGEGTAITGEESLKLTDIAEVFDAEDASDRYVEITVDGGSPIAPRLRLLTSPYSFLATKAITADKLSAGSADAITFNGSDLVTIEQELNAKGATTLEDGLDVYDGDSTNDTGTGTTAIGTMRVHRDTGHMRLDSNEIQTVSTSTGSATTLYLNKDGGGVIMGDTGAATLIEGNAIEINGDIQVNDKLGIGEASPETEVHVTGSSTVGVRLESSSGTAWDIESQSDSDLAFLTGTTTHFDIASSGESKFYGPLDIEHDGEEFIRFENTEGQLRLDNNEIQAVNTSGNGTKLYLNHDRGGDVVISQSKLGIGTTSPSVPLHVASANSYSFRRTARYGNSSNSTDSDVSPSTAILATGALVVDNGGDGIYIVSDERIKDIQARVQAADSLARVMNLKVTDYKMRDAIRFGESLHLGLIAQELETVIPRAVSRGVGFLPDIYAFATEAHLDSESAQLTVRLKGDHDLKEGQVLRLIVGTTQIDRSVVALPDSASFVVDDWEHDIEEVFVFGRQVDDFRTVNYDHVLLHGLAALQEVNRRLETSNQELQARLALAEQRNQEFGRMLGSMNERIKSLEGVVASSEESGKDLVANFQD